MQPVIPFIDLKKQYAALQDRIGDRINAVLEHGQYIMGPEVAELEARLADYVGVRHCIGASSGTDTLLIAMMALGIGPGDEVITTPFTFIATAEMIVLAGARPVFVDIDPVTYNIDPAQVEAAVTPRTKAILSVSLYGQCADHDELNAIAARYGLTVIEDAAQSFGATYKGRRSCGVTQIASTSFFPSKPLGCYGDGGALFMDDDDLAEACRQIRAHGQSKRYYHPRIGINGRLDTLQAAILLAKMDRFEEEVAARHRVAARYDRLLAQQCPSVTPPRVLPHNTSVYAQYTIQVDQREQIAAGLKAQGIPVAVHYPVPIHRQPAYMAFAGNHNFPVSERMAERVMSLPMGPDLTEEEQDRVVAALASVLSP